jgi:hypothetical protein
MLSNEAPDCVLTDAEKEQIFANMDFSGKTQAWFTVEAKDIFCLAIDCDGDHLNNKWACPCCGELRPELTIEEVEALKDFGMEIDFPEKVCSMCLDYHIPQHPTTKPPRLHDQTFGHCPQCEGHAPKESF